jgi:tetratricopeptide (TPR) repeat protein
MLRSEPMALGQVEPAATQRSARTLSEQAQDLEAQAGAAYNAGRYEEALRIQQQSVQLHRQLVAQDSSQRPKLASSLHNLGVVLIRLGRKGEAILPTEESLALYRAEAVSQGSEGSQELERPLRNLVLLYFEGNRPQDALPLADQLVRLHQRLAADESFPPLAQAEEVDVLNLRANVLVSLNRPREALHDLEAAVSLSRELNKRVPQNLALMYSLAGSLVNFSQVADLLGQFGQALPPAQDAEALLRQISRAQPQLMGDWAKSLSRLGQAYAQLGEPTKAKPHLEEAIALMRLLSRSGPSATLTVEVGGYRDDLAHALETLALVQRQLQRPEEARAAGVEAMAIYKGLAQADPRYQKDVERTRSWLTSMPRTNSFRP